MRQKALVLCQLCPKSSRNFWLRVKGQGMKGTKEREINGCPSRGKRKCRLWLFSVRNWWPNSPVCIQSESLDKTIWASLASLLFPGLVHRWGVTTPVLPAVLPQLCLPAPPLVWPSCVWHIPALPKHKFTREVLRTQTLWSSSWEELDLQLI